MNKLLLNGPVWVVSDTHLGPESPATQRAFIAFLKRAEGQANALLLCGDIFEAWIGDDQATNQPELWLRQVTDALKRTSEQIPVFVGRGNRDFLIGHRFTNLIGAKLLDDQTQLETAAGNIVLSHGDEYCTDDTAYQRLRHWVRKPWVQRLYLSLSLATRERIATWARERSRKANAGKQMTLLDVNDQTVRDTFKTTGCSLMIHGHTHRPACHTYSVDTRQCVRHVLPDWDFDHSEHVRGGWIVINEHGIQRHHASKCSVS